MLAFGLSAGGAGAPLLALAPLSMPSLAMIWRVVHRRVLIALASLTILAGILAGFAALALRL